MKLDHMSALPMFSDCASCARLEDIDNRTCEAFPSGIPEPIWKGEQSHKTPVEGDGGIVYKPNLGGKPHHIQQLHNLDVDLRN